MGKDEEVVGSVSLGNQEVLIIKEPGLTGYRFDAVGDESLSLAVDLACLQTSRGVSYIEGRFGIKSEVLGGKRLGFKE